MNVLDRSLVQDVADRLRAQPGLIEKDWHVTRAIGVLAGLNHGSAQPAFGGGTSLSKAWGLMKRFSEDIDFKVAMPANTRSGGKKARSAYRQQILTGLTEAGFILAGEPFKRDENHFFSAELLYPSLFETGVGLRPHLQIEMLLKAPARPPIERPIASLIGMAQRQPPEVAAFLCVDPIETAADKLSALAWRVRARRRGSAGDDPTIIRHLHELAALQPSIAGSSETFISLVRQAMAEDTGRGGEATAASDPAALFARLLDQLDSDPLWAIEYRDYVEQVSFAEPGELAGFDQAVASLRKLIDWLQAAQ